MALTRDDRITCAGIQGVAEGHAGGITSRAATFDQLCADLAAGEGPALAAAVEEIRERLPADPARAQQILDEAAARFTMRSAPHHGRALAILVYAGADENTARTIQAARGRGWRTPQAEPYRSS
jgi:hypothetical protein